MRHFSTSGRAAGTTVLACAVLWSTFTAARAQGPGTYSASFLKIPVGARLMSSPDVVAGMRPDASLLYSNPAFLSGLAHPELFASSSRWLDDLSFTSLGASIPLRGRSTVLGIGTSLLYSGGLKGYDDALNVVSEESFYDLGLDLAVSHVFSGTGLSAAAGVTYIREHVVPQDGSGYAFHLGAAYWLGRNLVHLALRDLGGSVDFASGSWAVAPEWLAGGGRVFDSPVGQFFAGAQVSGCDAYGTRVRLGVDYQVNSLFTLRSGFNDNLDEAQAESPFNAGFGMRYGPFAIEYAYTPQEYFSTAHTFSLGFTFGVAPGAVHPAATVPIGDTAPPISDAEPASPAPKSAAATRPANTTFLLVAGSHSWLESARSEVRALELLNIPAYVESEGPRFRVVIGRFSAFDAADAVRIRYSHQGHIFQIIAR